MAGLSPSGGRVIQWMSLSAASSASGPWLEHVSVVASTERPLEPSFLPVLVRGRGFCLGLRQGETPRPSWRHPVALALDRTAPCSIRGCLTMEGIHRGQS